MPPVTKLEVGSRVGRGGGGGGGILQSPSPSVLPFHVSIQALSRRFLNRSAFCNRAQELCESRGGRPGLNFFNNSNH